MANLTHTADYTQNLLQLIQLYQQTYPTNTQIQEKIEEFELDFISEDLPKMLSSMKVGADRIRSNCPVSKKLLAAWMKQT